MSELDLSLLNEDRAKKLLQLNAQLKGEPPVTPKVRPKKKMKSLQKKWKKENTTAAQTLSSSPLQPSKLSKKHSEPASENDDPNSNSVVRGHFAATPSLAELEAIALKKVRLASSSSLPLHFALLFKIPPSDVCVFMCLL